MFAHGEDELIKLDENATAKFKVEDTFSIYLRKD